MSPTNWRKVADDLAERLMYAAPCTEHNDPHSADASDCPFCADRRAVMAYIAAGGDVRLPSDPEDATYVNIADLSSGERADQ